MRLTPSTAPVTVVPSQAAADPADDRRRQPKASGQHERDGDRAQTVRARPPGDAALAGGHVRIAPRIGPTQATTAPKVMPIRNDEDRAAGVDLCGESGS